jgi:hypothetical protein
VRNPLVSRTRRRGGCSFSHTSIPKMAWLRASIHDFSRRSPG